jgi:Cu/Ag efflux protein CusF
MKKAVSIILALLFVFAITSISFAVEEKKAAPATEEKAMPAEKTKVKQVTGDVKAVDMKAKTITVTKTMKGKAEETVATVDDKTKIMMGEEKKALADVKVGEKVKVVYKEVEGKNVAKSITIMPAEKKAEPTKPTEKK